MDLVSIHVPKTAGSSFVNVLNSVFGAEAVFQDYPDRFDNPLVPFNDLSLPRGPITDILAGRRVVHGHFQATKYAGLFPEAKRIVWLRNPISRVISNYYYLMNVPGDPRHMKNPLRERIVAGDLSLLDFAQLPSIANLVSTQYVRNAPLEDFYFVGLMEFFEEDLRDLGVMLGWPNVAVPHENRTKQPEDSRTFDLRTIERFHVICAADMLLYDRALAVRAVRRRRLAHEARDAEGPARVST